MIIVFTRQAQRDLENIHAYIARDNPAQAYTVLSKLHTAINRLANFPEMGRVGRKPGTRELIVPRLRYRVHYRVRSDRVQIIRVRHTSQND